ncbi:MAG: HupE/UreJ family protein [Cystobacter sp.]
MGWTWKVRWVVALVLCLLADVARAHDADILYAQLWRPDAGGAEVRERITLTAESLSRLLPADADEDGALTQADLDARARALEVGIWDAVPLSAGGTPCTRTAQRARVREGYVELGATFACAPGELRQRFTLLSVLPPGYKVVLGSVIQGEVGQRFADAAQPTLVVAEAGAEASTDFAGWVGLGITHILGGPDHLAFLLAVLLVGGSWRRVLALVTAFTVAHSLTLGATALGWLLLDDARARWVEAAIAASILWVAVDNLVRRAPRHRVAVTFLFGLVHGLGFANVLSGYGLGDSVVSSLFGFNLGVELGQAAVVALLLPVLRMIQRRPALHRRTVQSLSLLLAAVALYWGVERVFAPMS